ncbi:MAG: hypothetical protein JXB49_17980 [Bacteroidales bacterium]|nr:hypothetical protein [Bacteroidales bacterium]
MFKAIFDWFRGLPTETQSAIISASVTVFLFVIGGIVKLIYEKYSLNYKMKREYYFEQRKKIKEILSKSKTPLIKSAEELNYRLWNLTSHIDEKWHNVKEESWKEPERYYLRSSTYRLLSFLFWTLKAEESIYSFDLKQADKEDALYLKYIKTLKHFFCERELLDELGYPVGGCSNHFYKDDLVKYCSFIEDAGKTIDYKTFEDKFQTNYETIREVVVYITNIESDPKNLNYNTLKAFHLFLMLFLNKYGLDYHFTDKNKLKSLMQGKYKDIKIKKGLYSFLERNKVLTESKLIIDNLNLKKNCTQSSRQPLGFA